MIIEIKREDPVFQFTKFFPVCDVSVLFTPVLEAFVSVPSFLLLVFQLHLCHQSV